MIYKKTSWSFQDVIKVEVVTLLPRLFEVLGFFLTRLVSYRNINILIYSLYYKIYDDWEKMFGNSCNIDGCCINIHMNILPYYWWAWV